MTSTLFLILSSCIILTGSSVLGSQCPGQDWYNRKGTKDCYYIFNPKTSGDEAFNGPNAVRLYFRDAVRECQMRGGQLATFDTYDELKWVEAKITDKYAYFWIGLTFETLTWSWTNGNITKPYSDIGLKPSPTDPDTEDVERKKLYRGTITYIPNSKEIEFRSMVGDGTSNGYICKGAYSSRPWCKVEEGWIYYGGKCHNFYPFGETFREAKATCEAENGNIAVIRSDLEDQRMRDWLRDHVEEEKGWIGITIPSKTASTTVNDVKWLDGTPITGTPVNHWAGPNLTHVIESLPNGKSYCGLLHTKDSVWPSYYDYWWGMDEYEPEVHEWSFSPDCDQELPFFCEAPRNLCPYGWNEYENDCYKFVQDTLQTFEKARENCQKLKGELVMVKSGVVQGFIEAVIGSEHLREDLWIGLQGVNGRYNWIDGSSVEYQAWNGSMVTPEQGSNTNVCGYAQRAGLNAAGTGKWAVSVCSQPKGYICKTPASAEIPDEAIIHPPVTCDAPFTKYHEGCYLLVNEQKNRDDAQRYCQERSSVLAYTTTFGENVWMKKQIAKDIWLGIRREGRTGSFLEFHYSDGEYMGPGGFKNFYYASYTNDNTPCVVMASENNQFSTDSLFSTGPELGEWYYAACTEQREFMCYHPGTPIENPDLEPNHSDPLCGAGWFRNGDNCYHLNPNPLRWHLAKQTCQNLAINADLLYITTKEEEQFISDFMADQWLLWSQEYWIGLYSNEKDQWHWPFRDSKNKWHIPLAVTNWAYGEPQEPEYSFSSRCVYMDASRNPEWYAIACDEERFPFICKKTLKNDTQVTTPVPTPLPGQHLGCPADWHDYDGRCVRFVISQRDWPTAEQDCRVSGGHLLTLRDQNEFVSVSRFGAGSWTGLNAMADPGVLSTTVTERKPRVFVWSSGEPVIYTPWDVISVSGGVVGSTINDTNCVALTSTGFTAYPCHERRSYICERPLQSTSLTNPAVDFTQYQGCKVNGIRHHESCFYFGIDPNSPIMNQPLLSFTKANEFCQTNYPGTTLASVANANEQKFLNAIVASLGTDYWIGLMEVEDTWEAYAYFIDGTPVESSNWAAGQPKHSQSSDGGFEAGCVALHGAFSDHKYPGDWYVAPCLQTKHALCKGPSDWHEPHPTFASTPVPTGCPSSWKTSKDFKNCYKAYLSTNATDPIQKTTWREAEDFCSRFRGGHLASISTKEENDFIKTEVQKSAFTGHYQYWIGLWDRQPQGNHFAWGWTDGSRYSYSGFQMENHDDDTGANCAAVDAENGNWISQSCNNGWGWVCEIPKGNYYEAELVNQFPDPILPNANCGPATTEGAWYLEPNTQECLFFSNKEDTWENAQSYCESLGRGVNLATVTNDSYQLIQIKAAQLSPAARKYWIGLYQVDIAGREFAWVDGHFSAFRKWEIGQPDPRGTERCVSHNSRSGRWADENCGHNYVFICAKSNRVRPSREPTRNPNEGGCYDGWAAHGGNCYYISPPENVTWDEAHEKCTRELSVSLGRPAAELISIHDDIENDFIITHLYHRRIYHDYWIGLHEVTSGQWGWSDNSRIRYTNWHLTETPNNAGLECVVMGNGVGQTGRWFPHRCTRKTGFICKAPKDPQLPAPTPVTGKCGDGWTQHTENTCFAAFRLDEGKGDWDSAQQKCKSQLGGMADIAIAEHIYEDAHLHLLLHQISRDANLNHSRGASAWIGMREHLGNYKWHNSCPVRFTNFLNFATSLPDACVEMDRHGKWRARLCNESLHYVLCERRFEPCPPAHNETHPDLYCPENFPHECGRKCFRIEGQQLHHNNPSTFSRANAAQRCREVRGLLASIRSQEEQKCLNNYLDHVAAPMWIGLYQGIDPTTQQWVWKWEDDSFGEIPTTFVNWETEPKPPANENLRQACVAVLPNGKWINMPCLTWEANQTRGYICEGMKIRQEGATQRPHRGSTAAFESVAGSDGLTGGQIAGIVIGVLLAVAVVGAIGYVVMTGKTESVVSSVKSIRTKAADRLGVGSTPYARQDDKQRISEDAEYNGADQ
ncbi:macrophage mannose receptor 1-like [Paramacrobiotus metropolitanus]|uniref:macrophage mannose receptor 1-like n=1 Tax=Paramacrobiotus metropolitanus TaxID=2943436 RepID=UPI002445608F|nr:macrophage mannose receptor 1-like [Paramacrobiotus metropolitanus]